MWLCVDGNFRPQHNPRTLRTGRSKHDVYVEMLVEDCGLLDEVPENLRYYFDYEAFARDLELNGDVSGFQFAGRDWTNERI
jgi:antirestriction protein